jgi:hypothetical protein
MRSRRQGPHAAKAGALRHNAGVRLASPPKTIRVEALTPTSAETAAIVAALERFMRATAPTQAAPAPEQPDGWRAAALLEGAERDPSNAWPWINT